MYAKLLYFVGVICQIYTIDASKVPFITKCKAKDSVCIKKSANAAIPYFAAGLPELGVESMDPLYLDRVDTSSPNLKLVLRDIVVHGAKNCIIEPIRREPEASKIYISTTCDVTVKGKYEVDGEILLLKLQGKGDAKFELKKAQFDYDCELVEKTGKDGLAYLSLRNSKYNYTLNDKAAIDLENLFDGNEVLGRAARELFKSYPNEIVLEIGPPMFKAIVEKMLLNIKNFFRAVPLEDVEIR